MKVCPVVVVCLGGKEKVAGTVPDLFVQNKQPVGHSKVYENWPSATPTCTPAIELPSIRWNRKIIAKGRIAKGDILLFLLGYQH